MSGEKIAPFRANHVGSLLRPAELLQARDKHEKGEINMAQLREVEDRSIRDAVKMQEDVGMRGITDGEYRRTLWHADFLRQIEGVKVVEGLLPDSARNFQNPDADVQRSPTQFVVTGKLKHRHGIETENFKFLASVTKQTPKQCIPSPSLVHFRTGRGGVDKTAYPDMADFFADLARVYREEIAALA
ncbi:MAG: 5-methyltetrahydropteroyltriglutamate--homocysteine S-methyltransferase, partial [Deltaproteobacteria bacterium]|nr:5-methyltetrahydropteroyltriglutamate--homocysteine S-methyltransferase [Deltaproteobacteria bacterium]